MKPFRHRLHACVFAMAAWMATVSAGLTAGASAGPPLQEVNLPSPLGAQDAEASGLLSIRDSAWLDPGWTEGFWVILDEPPVSRALVRIGHGPAQSAAVVDWQVRPTSIRCLGEQSPSADDAEALARCGDMVYIFGSHFGSKKGPLDLSRQFVARFEDPLTTASAPSAEPLALEVVNDGFRLHRLLNDALAGGGVDLMSRGEMEAEQYIRRTCRKVPAAEGFVRAGDRALNIEGAVFLESGALLLGLRTPVSRGGHPLLIEIEGIERLFDGRGEPRAIGVWEVLSAGTRDQPEGIRDLTRHGSRIDALTGNLDRFSKTVGESLLLTDHPEGASAFSRQIRLVWPPSADRHAVTAESVRDFKPWRNAEGLAVDAQERFIYAFDTSRLCLRIAWP